MYSALIVALTAINLQPYRLAETTAYCDFLLVVPIISTLTYLITLCVGMKDATVILWRLSDTSPSANLLQDDDEENRESWTAFKVLRCVVEVTSV